MQQQENISDKERVLARFGAQIWETLTAQPLGSLPKRELELMVVRAAIEAGAAEPVTASIAKVFRVTPTRADAYLVDLALRAPAYTDAEALDYLAAELRTVEAVMDGGFISLPIRDARLRLWVEQKAAERGLHPGERINRSLIKLSVPGLFAVLDATGERPPAKQAFKALQQEHNGEKWVEELTVLAGESPSWREFADRAGKHLEHTGRLASLIDSVGVYFSIIN